MQRSESDFFLEHAAGLALESMLTRLDEQRDYRPFFWTELNENPPRLCHSEYDFSDTGGRYLDACILARKMLRIASPDERELGLKNFVFSLQDNEDGLFYDRASEDDPGNCPPFLRGYETFQSKADLFCQNQPLLALIALADGGEDAALDKIKRCLKTLRSYASMDESNGLFFERRRISRGKFIGPAAKATGKEGNVFSLTTAGMDPVIILEAISLYWKKTGDKLAEEFIRGLTNHIIHDGKQIYWNGMYNGHTHCGSIIPAMNGILTWAVACEEEQYILWAKRVLDWTLHNSSSFGWVPDGLLTEPSSVGGYYCETCSLADTIQLAVKLAMAGFDEYWEIIDRFYKNQLLENQYKEPETIEPLQKEFKDRDRIIQAVRGAFESWARPNYIYANRHGIEGCCTSSGVKALYAIWDNAITKNDQTINVNLFINRNLPFAEIRAFEPERGLLKIKVKQENKYQIRISSFLNREQIRLTINDNDVANIRWKGNYLLCSTLTSGDVLEITYPLPRKKLREVITNAGQYWVSWLGNWVTEIEPISALLESETDEQFTVPYPIYQRQRW